MTNLNDILDMTTEEALPLFNNERIMSLADDFKAELQKRGWANKTIRELWVLSQSIENRTEVTESNG